MRQTQSEISSVKPANTSLLMPERESVPAADVRENSVGGLLMNARILNGVASGNPAQARQTLLQLQRVCGNRYVQRVLAIARQANSDGSGEHVAPEVESAIERSRSGGQPLDRNTRGSMESAFGVDFGGVRIHTDSESNSLNRAVNAVAFTTGSDIFFRSGAYQPEASGGRELLAHELTHVVQQGGASTLSGHAQRFSIQRLCAECEKEKGKVQTKLTVGEPDDQYEQEANRVAKMVSRTIEGQGAEAPKSHDKDEEEAHSCTACGQSPHIQRTLGDGHDLRSPRFAGDPVLEACFDNQQLLTVGSRGDAVKKIQQALIDTGFPLPKFGVDGDFGAETQTAVRGYQTAHGLSPDGIVGPKTMGSLDALLTGPAPGPAPPAPAPTGPAPAPPGPAPAPPGPAPAPPSPAEKITSQTVELTPGARTRTTIGVGEEVNLTHTPGSAAWTTTAGKLSAASGPATILTAPDTAQTVTVTGGGATLAFNVIAPTSVTMDREPGTGVKHTLNRADSGIQTRVFLGADNVNFSKIRYRELDVAGTGNGVYSCNPFSGGHCGAGGGGAACPDKSMTSTVVSGKGTQSTLGDCAYSGHCGGAPPFAGGGTVSLSIPYEYKVGAGAFRHITNVPQAHTLAGDGSKLTSDKAGAHGETTVATPSVAIAQCP